MYSRTIKWEENARRSDSLRQTNGSRMSFSGFLKKKGLHSSQFRPIVLCIQSSHTPPLTRPVASYTAGSKWHLVAWLLHSHSANTRVKVKPLWIIRISFQQESVTNYCSPGLWNQLLHCQLCNHTVNSVTTQVYPITTLSTASPSCKQHDYTVNCVTILLILCCTKHDYTVNCITTQVECHYTVHSVTIMQITWLHCEQHCMQPIMPQCYQ